MATVMGIDPGKRGGICVIDLTTHEIEFWLLIAVLENRETPFYEILKSKKVKHVYLEKAQAFKGQGITSTFNYGSGYGYLRGLVAGFRDEDGRGIGITLVSPQVWTKEMHFGCTGKDPKQKSSQAALQLFPGRDFRATNRSIKLHDGLIDSLLLAEWGRRHYKE